MNSIASSKNSAILLVIALIAAMLFAVYYYVLSPKLDEVEAKETTLGSLNQDMMSIQEQIAGIEETLQTSTSTSTMLRKKVPQTRAIEKVILDIGEIEAVTGTLVESVSFNNYDSLVIESTITDPNAPIVEDEAAQATTTTTQQADTTNQSIEVPVSTIAKDSLPAELKLVTFSIEIVALDMQALKDFLQEIENIERVMKIDTLTISSPGEEVQFQEDADAALTATVQVTTFYYEGEK